MELFDEDEVVPASEMQRPQQALDREMFEDANKRFNKADGGMLVKPGFGGTRQGYAKMKEKGFQKGNTFGVKENIEERNIKQVADKQKRVDLAKKFIIEGDSPAEAKKKVIRQFNLKRDPKAGTPRWLTQAKEELKAAGIKFKESKRGPEPIGDAKEKAQIKRDQVIGEGKAFEERIKKEKTKTGFGKKFETAHTANIFQAKKLGIEYPVDALAIQATKVNQEVAENLNNELKPLYKKQLILVNKLKKNNTLALRKELDKLNRLISETVATGGKQGKIAANVLKPIIVDPNTLKGQILDLGFDTTTEVKAPPGSTTKNIKVGSDADLMARMNIKETTKMLASFSANPKCRGKFSRGGRIGYATGPADLSECAISGKNRLEKVIKTGVKLGSQEGALATQILKAGRSLGSAFTLSGLLGPQALAFTALAEAGIVGYDMLTTGKTFKETIGDSLLNYALGEKTKIDPDKELIKRFGTLPGMTDDKLAGIKNVLDQTNTLNTILKQDLKVGNLKDEVKAFREQPKDQFMLPDDEMLQTDTAIRAEQALKDEQENLKNLLINYRSQPPVGLNMEDTILGDMASGKFQNTKQDLDEAVKAAEIQKLESKGPVFMGKVFPKFEEGRQEKLLNLRGPELTPFAGGGIAKLAGIDEGPQTVSMNPDSQGLRSLKNRVKNI